MPSHPSAHSFKKASRVVSKSRLKGLSLIELMISITVGLLVLLGLIAIYLNASRSNTEFAKMNRQIENGRYALQILREDFWHAGFWGEYKPPLSDTATPVDPCLPFGDWDDPDDTDAGVVYRESLMAIPVQGYDNGSGLTSTDCGILTNHIPNTDVVAVRYASRSIAATCPDDDPSDPNDTPRPCLQVSLCADSGSPLEGRYLDTDAKLETGNNKACTGPADKRRFVSHLYYVAAVEGTDGNVIPNLMRWVHGESNPQPLIEGIENLELEYGVDSNGDGDIDDFTSTPSNAQWRDVVGIKVHLLARNLEATPGYTDEKTYPLGSKTVGPLKDGFKRHAYSSFVRLNNPSMRREGTLPSGSNAASEGESGTDADAPDSGSDATGDAS